MNSKGALRRVRGILKEGGKMEGMLCEWRQRRGEVKR